MERTRTVTELTEGARGFVTYWAIDGQGRSKWDEVSLEARGTVCVEVVKRGDSMYVTPQGLEQIAHERRDELPVATMAEGDVGYTTEWMVSDDGTVRASTIQRSRGGTVVVEVRMESGRLVATRSGLLSALAYLRMRGRGSRPRS